MRTDKKNKNKKYQLKEEAELSPKEKQILRDNQIKEERLRLSQERDKRNRQAESYRGASELRKGINTTIAGSRELRSYGNIFSNLFGKLGGG